MARPAPRNPPLPHPARRGVMADDADLGALGAADPLAGRLGDAVEDRRSRRHRGAERQRDPVTRRLDLLDRVEPGSLDRGAEPGLGVGDLRVGGDDIDPVRRERSPMATDAPQHGAVARRHRPARHVRAATRRRATTTGQGERPPAVIGRRGTAAASPTPRDGRPRPAIGRRGRRAHRRSRASQSASSAGVASRMLNRRPRTPLRFPPSATPPRRRAQRTRPRWASSYAAVRRAEHQVPRADVPDLATAEPGLEVGDPAGRQAPQVVARRAGLPRRADGLPLEEVVGP